MDTAPSKTTEEAGRVKAQEHAQGARTAAARNIKPLTSFRVFAAFAIVLYHASDYFNCWRGLDKCYCPGHAVTFFFILSGFILTHNYFDLGDLKGACNFYLARISRIWPAHVATLLLLVFLIPEVFKPRGGDWPIFWSNFFMLQSWWPSWKVYFSYNAPSWSNATEVFAYVWFPLLLIGMRKRWYLPILITAPIFAALLFACIQLHLPEYDPVKLSYQGVIFIHPLSRIFEFAIGMTTAVLFRNYLQKMDLKKGLATALEIATLVVVCLVNILSVHITSLTAGWASPAGAYWLQTCAPAIPCTIALICIFSMEKGHVSTLLSNRGIVMLGNLSFGMYMLHAVMITYFGVNFPQEQSLTLCLTYLACVWMAAHLMSELFEKPLRAAIMSGGNKVISHIAARLRKENEAQPAPEKKKKPVSRGWYAFMAAELAIFAGLIYVSLPTIHPVTKAELSSMVETTTSGVRDLVLAPSLICRFATARAQKDSVSVNFAWEALKSENVNFAVTAILLDKDGNALTHIHYAQDGRYTRVKPGVIWLEKNTLKLPDAERAATVKVSVLRNRQNLLHSNVCHDRDFSFMVPVCR
jgi:peptidoglycan/LPS O-acetylase OafA/YrhL